MQSRKSIIEVVVEVTSELEMDGRKQVVWVCTGDKHPEKNSVWKPDTGPIASGLYLCTKLRKGKYNIELDLSNLTLIPAVAKTA